MTLPLGGGAVTEEQFSAAFDKASGEALAPGDLFTRTGETLATALLDAAAITGEPRRSEMLAVFDERRVVFRPDALEVFFPGALCPARRRPSSWGLITPTG